MTSVTGSESQLHREGDERGQKNTNMEDAKGQSKLQKEKQSLPATQARDPRSSASQPAKPSSSTSGLLIPPFRYAIVEEGLYRGAYPTHRNFRFMKRLRLRVVLSFIPKDPHPSLVQFCEENDIVLKVCRVNRVKDDQLTITHRQVVETLEMMMSVESLPMYIHSSTGGRTTAVIIACLRKLQNWDLVAILTESTRFSSDNYTSVVASFVESFKATITVPRSIPKWLWGGKTWDIQAPSMIELKLPSSGSTNSSKKSVDEGTREAVINAAAPGGPSSSRVPSLSVSKSLLSESENGDVDSDSEDFDSMLTYTAGQR